MDNFYGWVPIKLEINSSAMTMLSDRTEMPCQHLAALLAWTVYGCTLAFCTAIIMHVTFPAGTPSGREDMTHMYAEVMAKRSLWGAELSDQKKEAYNYPFHW